MTFEAFAIEILKSKICILVVQDMIWEGFNGKKVYGEKVMRQNGMYL